VSLLLQGAPQATGQGSWNLSGFENLSGSSFNDALTGDNGDNLLAGYSGNDVLSGGKGDDNLLGDGVVEADTHDTGGSGPIVTIDDVSLVAFPDPAGNDVLDGGKGDDRLNGGGGDDILTGGNNKDVFVFQSASGDDHITDFAKHDKIQFDGVVGVDDFSDLTLVAVGPNVLITWGTGDSIVLDSTTLGSLSAADFIFS